MKFKVYKRNPVNCNVGYRVGYDLDMNYFESIECNYRHITPTKIVIEYSEPFYYAVDESNNSWRAVDITYSTNTKVTITLISQTLQCLKDPASYVSLLGDINFKPSSSYENSVVSSPSQWLRNNLNQVVYNYKNCWTYDADEFRLYCIIQTVQQLADPDDFKTTLGGVYYKIADGWWSDTIFESRENATNIDYTTLDPTMKGALGVNMYYIRLDGGISFDFLEFLSLLVQTRTDFINARLVVLPRNTFNSSSVGEVNVYSGDDYTFRFKLNFLLTYKANLYTVDQVQPTTILSGSEFWMIGEHTIYPNLTDDGEALLRCCVFIGVGTIFCIFFTGNLLDLNRLKQSAVIAELGYNISPNTVNPSIYYTNKQYQSMVNRLSYLPSLGTMAGAAAGILLMPKAPLAAKIIGAGAGLANSVGSLSKGQMNLERERFNRGTVNNTNDVQDISEFVTNLAVVTRISYYPTTVTELNLMLAEYTPHTSWVNLTTESVDFLKAELCANEINNAMLREGCLVVDGRQLGFILSNCG